MKLALLLVSAIAIIGCSTPDEGARGTAGTGGGSGSGGSGGAQTDGGITILPPTTCRDVVCDPNATCSGTGADAKCACVAGYTGDGVHCDDVDECAPGATNDCDANAACKNRPGGYTCTCNAGYTGDGKTCTVVDQCQGVANTCDPNATCVSQNPGFTCECKSGFTGDATTCGDVDECKAGTFSCATNAHCVNTFGGYDCACDPGFSGDGNQACTSLCDAAKSDAAVCGAHGLCRIDGAVAVCDACVPGYAGDGKTCAAKACDAQCDGTGTDDDPHAVCGADGTCTCAPGFSGAVGSCADTDECKTDNGGCDATEACTNVLGGHVCTCKPGLARDSSGKCVDVDECKATVSPCHPDATCTNVVSTGSGAGFTCKCKDGFTGDGATCVDVDECKTDNGGCDASATCENRRGSFACTCAAPLVGDGKSCHCDLTGLWAMRQDLDTCWKGRPVIEGTSENLVSPGSMEATVWELHELTYDGQNLVIRRKGCGTDNTPDLISPLFRETYSSYTPNSLFDPLPLQASDDFAAPGIRPGDAFQTPSSAAVVGIDLGADPLNAPWPATSAEVTTWTDPDNDGEPGFSLWPRVPSEVTDSGTQHYSYLPVRPVIVSGPSGNKIAIDERAGCVSVAARIVTHLEATVESCTRITGRVVNEKSEGRVHSCTVVDKGTCDANNKCDGWTKDVGCGAADWTAATKCEDADVSRLDDDQNQAQDSRATFELVRIGDKGASLDCPDVRSQFPALAHNPPTISCTTPP
ncbi:MAG TPA: EGF domain-containing protein [Polyangiaceae bacterium]|nr:EGF domain-containing protein [Polyangiaceae bacterium]